MTEACAMRGTRMGRHVKTPEEVIEECRNYPVSETTGTKGRMDRLPNGNFLFFDVMYQGEKLPCIERPMEYLDHGKPKSLDEHLAWLFEPSNNMTEYTIADMELEYQMARISFELRDDARFGELARQYIEGMHTLYAHQLFTADRFDYFPGKLGAIVTNKGKIPSNPKRVIVPMYPSGFNSLSSPRSESELDKTSRIDIQTKRFLSSFLGLGGEWAGVIFSYLAPRQGSHLRGTRIRTLDTGWRNYHYTSIGGLGVDKQDRGRFGIQAGDVNPHRRVLVVALRNQVDGEGVAP